MFKCVIINKNSYLKIHTQAKRDHVPSLKDAQCKRRQLLLGGDISMVSFPGLLTGVTGLSFGATETETKVDHEDSDLDLGYRSRSSFESSSSRNTSPSSSSSSGCAQKAPDEDIFEAIKKLWTIEYDVMVPFEGSENHLFPNPVDVGQKDAPLRVCLDFRDILQPGTFPFRSGSRAVVALPLPVVDDGPVESPALPLPLPAPGSAFKEPTLPSDKTSISQVESKLQAARLRLTPKDFIVYPHQPRSQVGWEAVFFVEQVQNGNEPFTDLIADWIFQIELTRPGSVNPAIPECLLLHLDEKKSRLGYARYFCSFLPVETGPHILSVRANVGVDHNFGLSLDPDPVVATSVGSGAGAEAGSSSVGTKPKPKHIQLSPLVIPVGRCYPQTNRLNFIQLMCPPLMSFCSKASAITVYRPNNWIYVADKDLHQIVAVNSFCHIIHTFGSMGSGPGQLFRPAGIAVDHAHERVVVTDKDNHRISIFGLEGNFIFNFGKRGHRNGEFEYPWGVAVSPKGGIIAIADSQNHRIQLFDHHGNFLRKYSVFETNPYSYKAEFDFPRGICFNSDGSIIYVTDLRTNAVIRLNLDLTRKEIFVPPGYLLCASGLTVDETDNVIIADSKCNLIRILSPRGTLICSYSGSEREIFQEPVDVAVLKGGLIAVVDRRHRLRIF